MRIPMTVTLVSLLLLAGCANDVGSGQGHQAPPPVSDAEPSGPDVVGAPEDLGPDEPAEPHTVPIGPVDETFPVGPCVMHTTRDSVAISWESAEQGETLVEYGLDASYGERQGGEPGTLHQVRLSGLSPETLYHYRACSGGACTRDLTFSTAPEPGRPFRFAVYGDSRSDPEQHAAVAAGIIDSEPVLVVNTGDIVENGNREEYRQMHFEPTRRLGHHVPIYVAIGNHEWKEKETEVRSFRDYMVFPEDPGVPRAELSYTFTYGDAFFLVMDNTMDGLDLFFPAVAGDDPSLWLWLNEQVRSEAARAATWRFAFFHYPPDSPCHEDWINMIAMREHVLPLLGDGGFQAVFAGHVHDYERQDHGGLAVFVTGGGGAGLESEEGCVNEVPQLAMLRSVHHFLTVDLEGETATVRAVDLDGEVFDSMTLTSGSAAGEQ